MRIGILLARKGSKGIPGKNGLKFLGKPLVYWALDAAFGSCLDIVVFVSDWRKLFRRVSRRYSKYSLITIHKDMPDDHTSVDGVLHVLKQFAKLGKLSESDICVLLQATSPYTTSSEIDTAVQTIEGGACDSVVTCGRIKRYLWSDLGYPLNYELRERARRQDWAGTLIENGAIYASRVRNIIDSKNVVSGRIGVLEQPYHFELDTWADWAYGIVEMGWHDEKQATSQ
jgi:N-acylneuraminate cytidylyltransferase